MTYQQCPAPWNVTSRLLRLALLPVITCAILLFATFAQAQEFRGTISGTITDPTGAAVPNAQVTITEKNTGTVNKTTSGSSGEYVVPFLPPGEYQILINTP